MKQIWIPMCISGVLLGQALVLPSPLDADSSSADSLHLHNSTGSLTRHSPYDISKAGQVDSADVYRSPSPNFLLALPRTVYSSLFIPLGMLAIRAERGKLAEKFSEFFTNEAGTFGVFPQVQLGGETGSGGGARLFHTDLWGNGKQFQGFFIYAGGRGQMAGGVYLDPSLLGSSFVWKFEGEYLRTRNRSATVNAAVREDDIRLYQIERADIRTTLGWRLNAGDLATHKRNFIIDVWAGYGRRDLRQREGPPGPLTHPGSTARANALNGLGLQIDLYRFGGRVAYDDRDHKRPVQEILLPLNYVLPGRVLTYSNGLYHSYRDLGYPEGGGLIAAEAEWVSGSEEVKFTRIAAELSRYVTLFWRDRILALRARLEKVSSADDNAIPYTDLVLLGGSTSARGYRRGYFRGQGALLFSVEYRYPIWDTWNAFVFWDETQIFDDFDEIEGGGFRTSWGGGISLRTEIGLLGKIRVGHSAEEKALVGLVMEQAF